MKKNIGFGALTYVIIVMLISLSCATQTSAQDNTGSGIMSQVTVTATVTKINHKKREVTIKTPDGQVAKFVASTDVQNLDQIKKGDVITAVYTEAFSYEIRKHATTGASVTGAAAASSKGEKPAAAVAQQYTVTVEITAINTKTSTVTIKGSDGETQNVVVKDASKLQGLKVGDMVDITYTEAFAIKVEPKPKK